MKTVFLAFTLKNSSVAEFFVELANELSLKYKVIIFTHAEESHSLKLNKSIEIRKWPSPRPTRLADIIFLRRMVLHHRPWMMISNFAAVNVFLIIGFLSGISHRIAWYHTLSSQLEKNRLLKFRKSIIYKLATKLIANSNASKNDLIKNFGVEESKVLIVYNALQQKGLKNSGQPDKIVYAGRLDAVKGLSTLVQAMAIVVEKYPLLRLHIIGDDKSGDEAEKLKVLVRDLKLETNIFFEGNKSRDIVLKEFSTAWFSIVPSRVEAFGYVVIESFSVGTPVVGSDTTGIAEIIRDKKDGFLFKVENFHDLAEKMVTLLKKPELRNQMSSNCEKRFQEKFELSGSVRRLGKILDLT